MQGYAQHLARGFVYAFIGTVALSLTAGAVIAYLAIRYFATT